MELDFDESPARRRQRVLVGVLVAGAVALAIFGLTRINLKWPTFSSARHANVADEVMATFPERFPRVALVEGLLDAPIELDSLHGWSPEILATMTWTDGTPVLLRGRERRYEPLGAHLESRGKLDTEGYLFGIRGLPSPHGATRSIAIDAPEKTCAVAECAIGVDAEGATTWRWKADERSIKTIAILYDEQGASGVVVGAGGAQGIVALDLDGHPLWDVPKQHVAYELRTHPDVPGRILFLAGKFTLFDGVGKALLSSKRGLPSRVASRALDHFVTSGLLFPGPAGSASMILAGDQFLRLEDDDRESWRATPSTPVRAIELVEPPGHLRLLVVTTDDGELLVLDEDGTLRARARLPDGIAGRRMYHYGLAAGRLGPDGWAAAVKLLNGTYVYRLHPERLPAR